MLETQNQRLLARLQEPLTLNSTHMIIKLELDQILNKYSMISSGKALTSLLTLLITLRRDSMLTEDVSGMRNPYLNQEP
jgi:hypothetical protein